MSYVRALLLADGPSDEPLGGIVAHIANVHGVELDVVAPDPRRLRAPSQTIADRLETILSFDDGFDVVIVHRDAESETVEKRLDEIQDAISSVCAGKEHIPVIPVRMTEAWLLVDEASIREVAGNPNGTAALSLPRPSRVDGVADAKKALSEALVKASGATGRRRSSVKRQFPNHRRRLLEKLDIYGSASTIPAIEKLKLDVVDVLSRFGGTP